MNNLDDYLAISISKLFLKQEFYKINILAIENQNRYTCYKLSTKLLNKYENFIEKQSVQDEYELKCILGVILLAEEDFNVKQKIIKLVKSKNHKIISYVEDKNHKLEDFMFENDKLNEMCHKYGEVNGLAIIMEYKNSRIKDYIMVAYILHLLDIECFFENYYNELLTEIKEDFSTILEFHNVWFNTSEIIDKLYKEEPNIMNLYKKEIIKYRTHKDIRENFFGNTSKVNPEKDEDRISVGINLAVANCYNLFVSNKIDIHNFIGDSYIPKSYINNISIAYGMCNKYNNHFSEVVINDGVSIGLCYYHSLVITELLAAYDKAVKFNRTIIDNMVNSEVSYKKEYNEEISKLYDKTQKEHELLTFKLNKEIKSNDEIKKQNLLLTKENKLLLNKIQELEDILFEESNKVVPCGTTLDVEEDINIDYEITNSILDICQNTNEMTKNKKIIVLGGSENWQGKLRTLFPNWTFIDGLSHTFDAKQFRYADSVILNTVALRHSVWNKVKYIIREYDIHHFYIDKNNIDGTVSEIAKTLSFS